MSKRDSPARDRVSLHYRDRASGEPRELPLKILVIGDFLGHPQVEPIDEREPIRVDERSFAGILAGAGVCLELDGGLALALPSLAAFEPSALAEQLPRARARLRARERRATIVRWLVERRGAAAELQALIDDPARLRSELADAPAGLLATPVQARLGLDGGEPELEPLRRALAVWLVERLDAQADADPPSPIDLAGLDAEIVALDQAVAAEVHSVLDDPRLRALEALWRGLDYLVSQVEFDENCEVHLLAASKRELVDDFEDAPEIIRSGLYRRVYASEYGTFGGQPYGLIVTDFDIGPSPVDLALLGQCAAVAAMAHVPFVANASPRWFGDDRFEGLAGIADLRSMFAAPQYRRWQQLRASPDARYVGLCLPRVLLRGPAGVGQDAGTLRRRATDHLWGPAAFAFATRVAASFARHRWCLAILGPTAGGAIEGLPTLACPSMRRRHGEPDEDEAIEARMSVEVQLGERHAVELAEEGFIPLVQLKRLGRPCLFSANSCQRPAPAPDTGEGRARWLGARIGAQLPYLFLICRIAHYLKVLQREEIGRHLDRAELERELDGWLRQYVADMDDPAPAIRAKRPLRGASITIEEVPGQTGWMRAHLQIRPHLQVMGASFTLSLVAKLEREGG